MVFSDQEISQFRLKRRVDNNYVKFKIQQILGPRAVFDTQQLEEEVQHLLAQCITKILDQKSIREAVSNLNELVIEELQKMPEKQSSQASKKLMQALQQPVSNDSMLSQGMNRSLSQKGLIDGSNGGLRSQALL